MIIIGLSSCGYSRLNDQSNKFKFNSIEINGDKRLSYILKNNLNLLSKPESKKSYDLLINLCPFLLTLPLADYKDLSPLLYQAKWFLI